MKNLVLAQPGRRFGIAQEDYYLVVKSLCCNELLKSNDKSGSHLDTYECSRCHTVYPARKDSVGGVVGVRIGLSCHEPRLEDWTSAWLGVPARVRVDV